MSGPWRGEGNEGRKIWNKNAKSANSSETISAESKRGANVSGVKGVKPDCSTGGKKLPPRTSPKRADDEGGQSPEGRFV